MDRPSGETTASTTFVVRFWREWTGAESRWRGRVEHVQSGRRHDFLGVEGLLVFLERFGIGAKADAASSGTKKDPGACVIDDMRSRGEDEL